MGINKRGGKKGARGSRQVDGRQSENAQRVPVKKDAERWEREQKAKIERGAWVQPTKVSLNAFLDTWLAGLQGPRERTRQHYRDVLALYVRPALGEVRLDQLSTMAIRAALAGL